MYWVVGKVMSDFCNEKQKKYGMTFPMTPYLLEKLGLYKVHSISGSKLPYHSWCLHFSGFASEMFL